MMKKELISLRVVVYERLLSQYMPGDLFCKDLPGQEQAGRRDWVRA